MFSAAESELWSEGTGGKMGAHIRQRQKHTIKETHAHTQRGPLETCCFGGADTAAYQWSLAVILPWQSGDIDRRILNKHWEAPDHRDRRWVVKACVSVCALVSLCMCMCLLMQQATWIYRTCLLSVCARVCVCVSVWVRQVLSDVQWQRRHCVLSALVKCFLPLLLSAFSDSNLYKAAADNNQRHTHGAQTLMQIRQDTRPRLCFGSYLYIL